MRRIYTICYSKLNLPENITALQSFVIKKNWKIWILAEVITFTTHLLLNQQYEVQRIEHWVKWCNGEISKPDVISGNISAAKFPVLQTVRRRRIRRGTVSTCWPRNELLCFALRRTLCSSVCTPVFVNVRRLCIIPPFGQLMIWLPVLQLSACCSLNIMKIPTIPVFLFVFFAVLPYLPLPIVSDWLNFSSSWIMTPCTH